MAFPASAARPQQGAASQQQQQQRARNPRLIAVVVAVAVATLVTISSLSSSSAVRSINASLPPVDHQRRVKAAPDGDPAEGTPPAADDRRDDAAASVQKASGDGNGDGDREPKDAATARQEQNRDTASGGRHREDATVKDDAPQRQPEADSAAASSSKKGAGSNGAGPLAAPPRTLDASDTQMHVITVQTKGSPGWCRMLRTAALSGIDVISIGWGQDYAHRKRPEWILQWLEKMRRPVEGRTPKRRPASPPKDGESGRGGSVPKALPEDFDDPVVDRKMPKGAAASSDSEGAGDAIRTRPLDDWDVVMFLDGGDSAFTGFTPAEILKRFTGLTVGEVDTSLYDPERLETEKEQRTQSKLLARMGPQRLKRRTHPVPLLFNAEANCYHQQLFNGEWASKKSRCITTYKKYNPWAVSKWRYLNGGGWIGYAWAVKRFFTLVRDKLARSQSLWCDQSQMGALLLDGAHSNLVHLDTANALYLPTYHLRLGDFCVTEVSDSEQGDAHPDEDVVLKGEPSRGLRLCHSRNTPAVLHFNGKSEASRVDTILRQSLWATRLRFSDENGKKRAKQALENYKPALDPLKDSKASASRKPLKDVCPGYDVLPKLTPGK